ncbi:YggT family protein [Candidatus Desantisbacteria bacterium]|nr:YggT family protein [Candidatus Desantisbacteria bacterium]
MFILGNLLNAFATILRHLVSLYYILIIIRAVSSWIDIDPYNPIMHFIIKVTDPFLRWIKTKIPDNRLGMDISPIIAFFILVFIEKFFIESLSDFALRLK